MDTLITSSGQRSDGSMGIPDDLIKISIILCQKNHNTRLVYEDNIHTFVPHRMLATYSHIDLKSNQCFPAAIEIECLLEVLSHIDIQYTHIYFITRFPGRDDLEKKSRTESRKNENLEKLTWIFP